MYQQNMGQQGYNQHQHVPLQDGDLANVVLCELKRVAREYATACLEASNLDIRQLFEQLLHQTLRDQEHLYQIMGQLNLYGQPASAPQNELQKEVHNHQQQLGILQGFMQQWHGANKNEQAGFRQYGGIQQLQNQQYQQNQQLQQNQQQQNQQLQHNWQQQLQQNQQQLGQANRSMLNNQPMNVYSAQPFTQQHHSSAQSEATRETGSEPLNEHTSGTAFPQ